MGISANQARLMTLTARQHDLELRAQQISAGKMITSLESQQYATMYSMALNGYSLIKQAENVGDSNKYYKINDDGTFMEVDSTTSGATKRLVENVKSKVYNNIATASGFSIIGNTSSEFLEKAKTIYDTAVASLSSQEKLLDMELTQLNTEHNAVKTEYDSVKGLVSENTDKSFNVFG